MATSLTAFDTEPGVQESMLRNAEVLRLRSLVAPFGFDVLIRVQSQPGTLVARAEFKRLGDPHKELQMLAEFRCDVFDTVERWRGVKPTPPVWFGPVCDTPDAAFVAAELENWGRTSEERDYSKSSEV